MPSEIDFVPRQELMKDWEGDYAEMCNHFIYGQTLSFEKLLERIKELQDRFRKAFLRLLVIDIVLYSPNARIRCFRVALCATRKVKT